MFEILREEQLLSGVMLGLFALSLFFRGLLGALYQNMIREADNMSVTENKFLKQCKLKFSNCFQLNKGVANIPVFVDKLLCKLAVGPFSFETVDHLSGQLMLLSVVSAGVCICKGIMGGRMLGEILPFYIISFLELYLYFSLSALIDIRGKRHVLKVELVDYLENHLSARIHVTKEDLHMLQRDTQQSDATPVKTVEHRGMDMDLEKEELEALLEEVLGLYSGNYT
ncbi:MAG: hypothetical protein K6G30_13175 [Acetatifactor sp.]|nr:hypothetical protein [Acetatifactor sp.]